MKVPKGFDPAPRAISNTAWQAPIVIPSLWGVLEYKVLKSILDRRVSSVFYIKKYMWW